MVTRGSKSKVWLDGSATKVRAKLFRAIAKARTAKGWSNEDLAQAAGASLLAIEQLESGAGRVETLVAVMNALKLELVGLAGGNILGKQIADCRTDQALSVDDVAKQARLPGRTVADLEQGKGKAEDMFRLLAFLSPKVSCRTARIGFAGTEKKADSDRRCTPASLWLSATASFGRFSLDPCADRASSVEAGRYIYFSEGGDGLLEDWDGRVVWVNPPFSGRSQWVKRCHDQWWAKKAKIVVLLVPTSLDDKFFQTVYRSASVFAIEGRPRFTFPCGKTEQTKYSLMLVVWGANAWQKARFAQLERGFWLNAGIATAAFSRVIRLYAVMQGTVTSFIPSPRPVVSLTLGWRTYASVIWCALTSRPSPETLSSGEVYVRA